MKRIWMILGTMALSLLVSYSLVLAWGSATHSYIDDHIGKKWNPDNLKERYGGMAPDLFNFLFDIPLEQQRYLYLQTHGDSQTQVEAFLKVWNGARWASAKPYAYGFVSHNDLWGADYTAHHSGRTYGQGTGYIIAKASVLMEILKQLPGYPTLPDAVNLEIAHNLVESGVDILMKRIDPLVGLKVSSSALLRGPDFPVLLVKAYTKDVAAYLQISHGEAAQLISTAEREFRKTTILYGQALNQDEATAVQLISEQLAQLAKDFLKAYGITPPSDDVLLSLTQFGIQKAIQICAPDYAGEVQATTLFVRNQLYSRGIAY